MKAVMIYAGVLALAMIIFLLVPQIDLALSGLFYAPGHGFWLDDWPPVVFLYHLVPWITWGVLATSAIAAIWLLLIDRPRWRLEGKSVIFVVASIALGPGLLANTLLKDHWGRGRPAQIEAFGGAQRFTPALFPAAECPRNCGFVSGHAALGFSLVAFAFLLPPGRWRRRAAAAALGTGAIIGLGRIAQGAHFLSDVVFAGLLVYGSTALLYWWIVARDGLSAPPLLRLYRSLGHGVLAAWRLGSRASRAPPVRLGLAVTAAVVLLWISIDTVDRSLAFFFRARDSDFRALFDLTSRLGLTYGYLIVFGLTFVALHWGGSLPRLRFFARPMRAFSAIPAFLFASIAASGLVVDVLKFAFGRPRPKLLFGYGDYGFGGLGMSPDYWSFPSGHAATIAALATALWFVWPQHVLFYILVAAIVSLSRVAAGAHYLSDVFAGAMVAVLTTWAVAWLFSKSGIDLAAAPRGRGHSAGRPPWPCGRFGRAPFSGGHIGSQQAGSVDRADHQACNIGPKADCGSRIGSPPWPCASKLSTTSEAETPFTRR